MRSPTAWPLLVHSGCCMPWPRRRPRPCRKPCDIRWRFAEPMFSNGSILHRRPIWNLMSTGFAVLTSRPVPIPAPGAISARSWPICCGIMLPMPMRSGVLPRLPVPGPSTRLPRWPYASGPSKCCGVAANRFRGSSKHGTILWRCWPAMPLPVSPVGSGEVGALLSGSNRTLIFRCRQRAVDTAMMLKSAYK